MKAKGFGLAVVALLCMGGYSAYWYIHAQQIENLLQEKLANQQHAKITYDSIEKRGFPFSIQLALVNPKVHVENEAITFDLDGSVAARWSVIGDLKDIDVSGKSRFAMPFNEDGHISEMHFEGNTVAEIDSIQSIGDKGVLTVSNGHMRSSDSEGFGEFDWKFDTIRVGYDVKHPDADRSIVDLDVNLQGGTYNVKEPGSSHELIDFYRALVGTVVEKTGKVNSAFTLSCQLPSVAKCKQLMESPMMLLTQAVPKVSIVLKNGATSDALSQGEVLGSLTISEDEKNNVETHITASGFVRYLAAYHDAVIAGIDKLKELAETWDASDDLKAVKNLLANNSDSLKALVPHPETLGKIEANTNVLIVLNKRTFNCHVAVDPLGVSCDLYGISIKSDLQERNNCTHGDVGITLKNASNLVSELVSYYNRIEGVVNLFEQDTQKHLKPLPEGAAQKIVGFLSHLSANPADPNDLHITVVYNDGKLQIGPLTREEARAEFEELWAEIMLETGITPATP